MTPKLIQQYLFEDFVNFEILNFTISNFKFAKKYRVEY